MQGDEWEEKWGEHYWNLGRANKYADKWGREGTNVWHERWGEDYDGSGGCCKYTDKVDRAFMSILYISNFMPMKPVEAAAQNHESLVVLQWAERLLEGGETEQWGDKWEERFKDGSGGKQVCCAIAPSRLLTDFALLMSL